MYAGNLNEAKLLAEQECDCDGCCRFLGSDANAPGFENFMEERKAFMASKGFMKFAREVRSDP